MLKNSESAKMLLFWLSFAIAIQLVRSQNCPNVANSISLDLISEMKRIGRIRFPLYASAIEMVRLENGAAVDNVKLDTAAILNPKITTKESSYYAGGAYYYSNFSLPASNISNLLYVVCITVNVVQNGQVSPCRSCDLISPNCNDCSDQFYGFQSMLLNVKNSRIEIPFYDLPSPNMNMECIVKSKNASDSFTDGSNYQKPDPYAYYNTPSPYYNSYNSYNGYYNTPSYYNSYNSYNSYNGYYNTPSYYNSYNSYNSYNPYNQISSQFRVDGNTVYSDSCHVKMESVTSKTKLFSNSFVFVDIKNLKEQSYYEVLLKFEIAWNGTAPFDWPNPLPLTSDGPVKKTFFVSNLCE